MNGDVKVAHTGCICAEHFGVTDLDALDRLVNDEGMDQYAAARLLWDKPTPAAEFSRPAPSSPG